MLCVRVCVCAGARGERAGIARGRLAGDTVLMALALVFALSTGNGRLLDYLVAEGVSLDKRADDAPPEGVEDLRLYLAEGDNRARLLRVGRLRRFP